MKSVLFVDDEPRVLLGLKRMLHGMRGEWDMEFAEGPSAALQAVERRAFDVVVTDMRMPQMDGNALLTQVQKRSPSTIRIVLTGQADPAAALQATTLAHRFLSKPCDAESLKETVRRCCALQELLQQKELRDLVGAVGCVPAIPSVYEEFTRVLQDPDADLQALAKVVKQDPLICAKLLHLVNSAFFGAAQRIATIEHALNYLGTKTAQQLILNVELFERVPVDSARTGVDMLWEQRHSLQVADFSRRIAKDLVNADHAFTAGILHDVGRMLVAALLPERAAEISLEKSTSEEHGHAIEQAVLGATHAELGAYLFGLWCLPHPVVEAIAFHHRPAAIDLERPGLATVLHVADALIHEAEGRKPRLDETHVQRMGLSKALEAWRAAARVAPRDQQPS
ncbi:MAG: HDOD domain-containing protein [Planctomycetes bacterium]|nr:HDOD domain-containing protein [Planctomycetota bacterium]